MAGSAKGTKVSVYSKVNTLLVTSGVQFGFGHLKVDTNSAVLVPVVVCAGTRIRPFFVEVSSEEVSSVIDFENGSTTLRFTPGL